MDGDVSQSGGAQVENRGEQILELHAGMVFAYFRIVAMLACDLSAQDPEPGPAQAQVDSVERNGKGCAGIAAEEIGDEGDERHPEQQVQVRPQQAGGHVMYGVDQVVMVDPHDGDDEEAEAIA